MREKSMYDKQMKAIAKQNHLYNKNFKKRSGFFFLKIFLWIIALSFTSGMISFLYLLNHMF